MAVGHSFKNVAGAYRGTLGGLALGQAEDGITFEFIYEGESVVGDNLARSVFDVVYQGGNVFMQGMFIEANVAGLYATITGATAVSMWDTTFGKVGKVGTLAQVDGKAQPLVLTKVSGTSAQFATITAEQAIIAPGFPISQLLGNHIHRIPLRFQLLPYGALDAELWFVPVLTA